MKRMRFLIMAGASLLSLCGPRPVYAGTNAPPPVVVPHDDRDMYRDLRGAPREIQQLIIGFDQTRDKYLEEQRLLLIKLKHAVTREEREQIRDRLQANRVAFLAELRSFREQLKDDLKALANKISHQEFLRIMDAAHDAATEGGLHHHRGH